MKKRLRKKLHLGEYRELCFRVAFRTPSRFSAVQGNRLLDRFIEMIEHNGLQFGGRGGPHEWDGIVELCGRGSATDQHRETVRLWLDSQPEVSNIVVGELRDAWHGWD
jgi:uncharacterized protein YggL (DUF469 family)